LIIRIMADIGAREGEVANLRVCDLIARDRTYFLKLRGKTGEGDSAGSTFLPRGGPLAAQEALDQALRADQGQGQLGVWMSSRRPSRGGDGNPYRLGSV
jgi:hypothetical protein